MLYKFFHQVYQPVSGGKPTRLLFRRDLVSPSSLGHGGGRQVQAVAEDLFRVDPHHPGKVLLQGEGHCTQRLSRETSQVLLVTLMLREPRVSLFYPFTHYVSYVSKLR